jgi:hypothetical protein
MATTAIPYGYECWTLTERQDIRLEAAEMSFLRAVSGYRLIEHRRNIDIPEELSGKVAAIPRKNGVK